MRKNAGFTLFEVLIAMFILVSSVFALSDLQIKTMFQVLSDRERIDRVFLIKRELYKLYRKFPKKKKAQVIKLEEPDPEMKITTQEIEIGKKSILKDIKLSAVLLSIIRIKFGTPSGDSNGFMKSDAHLIKDQMGTVQFPQTGQDGISSAWPFSAIKNGSSHGLQKTL